MQIKHVTFDIIIVNGYPVEGPKGVCQKILHALDKQEPKIPNIEGDGYSDGHLVYDTWICPSCETNYEIDYDDYDYCPKCGQHIDRSNFNKNTED